jgi:GH25 family lysozyme M1 (1,4-beta-N-acetylmuramidase)
VESKIGRPILVRALDFETNPTGSTMSLSQAEDFALRYAYLVGRTLPLIYGGSLLRESGVKETSPLSVCELWLADYSKTPPAQPTIPKPWSKYRLWQWTAPEDAQCQPIPGIGKCDQSMFPGTPDDLQRWVKSLA